MSAAESTTRPEKPLGQKSYGSIPHLPGSRLGPGDHHCHEGQARIATEKVRDRHDDVIVQEKLDGGCVAVALKDGDVLALGRAGYLASSSPFPQHHLFADWVAANESRFRLALLEGERICGEWLAQAHGTIYELRHEPFVVFDLMAQKKRLPYDQFAERASAGGFVIPHLLHRGDSYSIQDAMLAIDKSGHGAIDPVEGAMWRVERRGVVDFLAKYVRSDKQDGYYLPEVSGRSAVWNWTPKGGDAL